MTPPEGAGASWEQLLLKMVDNLQTTVSSMDRKLDEMRTGMVPRPEFDASQRGIDRRFEELGRQVSEKREAHSALEAKIQVVDDKIDAREDERSKWSRDLNAKVWLAVGAGALSFGWMVVAEALGVR